ncbi:MAG: DEAD/DEAH box helicase [Bacteroidaceae bacterium]
MRKKTTQKTEKKGTTTKHESAVNTIVKPKEMTLKEWQIAIRKQSAQKELFSISFIDKKTSKSDFFVSNLKNKTLYKVVYRGENSEWNFCSCMDFKTSQLGTCKHIEAVKLYLQNKPKYRIQPPTYTSVYLYYGVERTIKIRIGSNFHEEFEMLAKDFFSEEGVLKIESSASLRSFSLKASALDDTFRIYTDVWDFIAEKETLVKRCHLLKQYFPSGNMDGIIKAKLYPYQQEGILFAAKAGKSIIADEMGLGKTLQAIATAEVLRRMKLISTVLIVCPTTLKYQWKTEIERFTNSDCVVIEGNFLKRKELYATDYFYKIVSYNAVSNDIKSCGHMDTDMLIMDEAQRLKNWNTQISHNMKCVYSDYTLVLTGTPLENKIEELYAIMQYVDQYCLSPFYDFMSRYVMTEETGKVIGYRNLNEVSERMKGRLLRRNKKNVEFQLPERMDKFLMVTMTKEQRKIHEELKFLVNILVQRWTRMKFLSEKDRKNLLVLLSKMRMVCDSTYILDQKTRFDTKIDELLEIITEMIESGDEKMVVFSQWERMTRIVAQELDARGIEYEYLHGGVPSEKRKDLMSNFTKNEKSRVFLSTDAGSTGLNLQAASILVNLDLPWNPAVLEQRIARIFRLGQKRTIQVYNFVTQNSFEEEMIQKLHFKSSLFAGVLDHGAQNIMLEENKLESFMNSMAEFVQAKEPSTNNDENDDEKEVVTSKKAEGQWNKINQEILDETTDQNILPLTFNDKENSKPKTRTPQTENQKSAKKIMEQGIQFFSGLAEMASSPEKMQTFVNTLVEEDEETGETTLRIPVPNKAVVTNLFQTVAKLMSGLK